MMTCQKCQTDMLESAKFCPECGTKAPQLKPEPLVQQIQVLPPVLTISEACELLRISKYPMYALINAGRIPYFTTGSHKRFVTEKLLDWAKNGGAS